MFFGVFDLPRRGDVVVALLLAHVTIVAGRWQRASNSSRSCRTGARRAEASEIKPLAEFSRQLRCYA